MPLPPGSTQTAPQWIVNILTGIGAPITKTNVQAIATWAGAENTSAAYNPLATTQPATGSSAFNDAGVQAYPDLNTGIGATVETLKYPAYSGIVKALQESASPSQIYQQINASPWGSTVSSATKAELNPPSISGGTVGGTSPNSGPVYLSSFFSDTGNYLKTFGEDLLHAGGNPAIAEFETLGSKAGQTAVSSTGKAIGEGFVLAFESITGIDKPAEFGVRVLEVLGGAFLFTIGLFALVAAVAGVSGGDIFGGAKKGAEVAGVAALV